MLGNGPQVLGNEPQVLGNDNGPLVLGNGPHLLGNMSHSALCRIQHYVAFSIMSHSALCRIQTYVVRDCVVWRNVVRPTVGESILRLRKSVAKIMIFDINI